MTLAPKVLSLAIVCLATACVATKRTVDLRTGVPPVVVSRLMRDVSVDVSVSSDPDETLGTPLAERKGVWRDQVLRGVRDAGLFRRVDSVESKSEKSGWLAEVALRRDRTSPGGLAVLCLLTGFTVPYYQQTDFVLSLVLSDPLTEEKLPAVVVRSGLREYLSWLALPFAFFTLSESDLEDQLTYELTRAALDEATRQGIVKVE